MRRRDLFKLLLAPAVASATPVIPVDTLIERYYGLHAWRVFDADTATWPVSGGRGDIVINWPKDATRLILDL